MSETCVILFADLAGSVQLYRQAGDEAAKIHVLEVQRALSTRIEQFHGYVQETIGDELMARFAEPNTALECSTALHQCAENYSRQQQINLQLRIGLHQGAVIVDKTENRLFGDTINVASRVTSIAQAGQTITTEALVQKSSSAWQASVRLFDVTPIKGVKESLVIYDLPWKQDDLTSIMLATNLEAEQTSAPRLTITYQNSSIELIDLEAAFVIGRALTNDLVVTAESVSRRHVSIERQRDHYVLIEQSTNGTYVYLQNDETMFLRREQFPLIGNGHIALGAPREIGDDHIVQFTSGTTENNR